MTLTTTTTTSTVTSAGYPPPGQQISLPPGPAQTKGGRGDTQGNYNEGGQTPDGDKGKSPTRSTQTTMPTSKATSREWGGGGDQGTAFDGGQPQNEPAQGPHQGPGGGIAAHLRTIKNRQEDAVIGRELDWQSRVEGDQAKSNTFRDQAVNQTTFRAFAFMKGRSPMVHMAHSVGQFFGMLGTAANIQGKYIGFIGDRGNGRHPVPLILPPPNVWA